MFEGVPEEKKEVTLDEALATINGIEQEERTRGRIDDEGGAFAYIRERLEAEQITPQQALEQANKIRESRQDYN